jgi:hypothetical protein
MATNNADITALLGNLVREQEFADTIHVHQRTVARYRQQGLPYIELGGKIYIDAKGAIEWIARGTTVRNQPRRVRSVSGAR